MLRISYMRRSNSRGMTLEASKRAAFAGGSARRGGFLEQEARACNVSYSTATTAAGCTTWSESGFQRAPFTIDAVSRILWQGCSHVGIRRLPHRDGCRLAGRGRGGGRWRRGRRASTLRPRCRAPCPVKSSDTTVNAGRGPPATGATVTAGMPPLAAATGRAVKRKGGGVWVVSRRACPGRR